jgi:hypothetical protein
MGNAAKKNQLRLARITPDLDPNEQTSPVMYECDDKIRYESLRAAETAA